MPFTQEEIDYHAHQGRMNYLRQQSCILNETREALEYVNDETKRKRKEEIIELLKSIDEEMKTTAKEFKMRNANKAALEEIERLKALLAKKD